MKSTVLLHIVALSLFGCGGPDATPSSPTAQDMAPKPSPARQGAKPEGFDALISSHAASLMKEGRDIFRHDTFGSESFWGGALGLHEAIEGSSSEPRGGVSPKTVLA